MGLGLRIIPLFTIAGTTWVTIGRGLGALRILGCGDMRV